MNQAIRESAQFDDIDGLRSEETMNSTAKAATAMIRKARTQDLNALLALENLCFNSDRLSRRSFRHFLNAQSAPNRS
ncbi:hypothetical protein ABMA58_20515, partial [Oceanospirillum sp. HFRX-1_2]